jgi:hypothetical protein
MPDRYGFDHLGGTSWAHTPQAHRCTEEGCGWPEPPRMVSERERKRHHEQHARDRARDTARRNRENLALARRLKRQAERENALLEERSYIYRGIE